MVKAAIFKTDDPPDKVIAFYKEHLKGKSRILETKNRGIPSAIFQVEVNGQEKVVSVRSDEDSGRTEIFIGSSPPKIEVIR